MPSLVQRTPSIDIARLHTSSAVSSVTQLQNAINQCVAGTPCAISLPVDFDMTSQVTIGAGLTVSISGTKGNGKTVLDANKGNRHFDIDPTSVVSFKDIHLKDGSISGDGGCILMYEYGNSGGGSLSVLDSTFEGCEAVRNCVCCT